MYTDSAGSNHRSASPALDVGAAGHHVHGLDAWAVRRRGTVVLTEIDVKATLKAKLGEDMEDYLILGACNPPLAHRAVNIDRQIGLLLPCNVVVRTDRDNAGSVLVEAMDPPVQVTGDAELRPVADEVTTKLRAAIDGLGASLHLLKPSVLDVRNIARGRIRRVKSPASAGRLLHEERASHRSVLNAVV